MPATPVTPSSATTASPRRSSARRDRRRSSRSPTSCARCRPANTCARRPWSKTCIGPTASAAPRPRASSHAGEMSSTANADRSAHSREAGIQKRNAGGPQLGRLRGDERATVSLPRRMLRWLFARLPSRARAPARGGSPRSARRRSGRDSILDRVSTATAGCCGPIATPEGRWRLPATRRRCRSALLRAAVRL